MNRLFWKLDRIGANIPKIRKIEDTIIISGTPRSGSTWLLEIIRTLKTYKTVVEPLDPRNYPEYRPLNMPARPYLNPNQENKALYNYLERLFKGKIAGGSPLYPDNIETYLRKVFARKIIVKFIRANRILPWITKNFNLKQVYLIIRHPVPTIISQIRTGYRGFYYPSKEKVPKKVIIEDALSVPIVNESRKLRNFIMNLDKEIDLLTVTWCLDNIILITEKKPFPWYTVFYEKLVKNGKKELETIFNLIGKKVPRQAYLQLFRPSRTTRDSKFDPNRRITKWKDEVSKEKITRILEITEKFGLSFYTEKIEPEYDFVK